MGMYFYDERSTSTALSLASGVFPVFAGFMVLYQKKLKQEQICWQEKVKKPAPATAHCANYSSCDVSGMLAASSELN